MKKFISTSETATLLGISRIAVFKKIKRGEIKAEKVGRNYLITKKESDRLVGKTIGYPDKNMVKRVVRRVIKEYGATLKKLAKE
jgi:excisionase family DNA binding protein